MHADLGMEFCSQLDPRGVDVLAVAGDFCGWSVGDEQSRIVFSMLADKYPRILYVPGNHEYWGSSRDKMPARFRQLELDYPHLTVLDNSSVEFGGQRFFGGTMWFGEPSPAMIAMKLKWPDYLWIKELEPWVYEQNARFQQMIRDQVRPGDIVISHHQPSYQSVAERYRGDPSNHFYVTEMDDAILSTKPALWLHGHTHEQFDYQLGETRVVCNPHGRPNEVRALIAFHPKKLIEVP
jgi:Icc-related predicted phosphoesterase